MSAVTLVCKADFVYILSLSCFAFIFVKYLFLRIILISVACRQYLVSTDLPLLWKTAYFLGAVMFPSHPPCDVHEWSWHLILCRYSFVWYDCAESLCFSKKTSFQVFHRSHLCCRKSNCQGFGMCPPCAHILVSVALSLSAAVQYT